MKKFTQCICVLLVIVFIFPTTVFAYENAEQRASEYFMSDSCYLHQTSETEFEVWFDVKGLDIMDEIGAKTVKVQRSSDGESWTTVKTFTKEDYPEMIDKNTGIHACGLSYTGSKGYSYRAQVYFYAKKGDNQASLSRYTSPIDL